MPRNVFPWLLTGGAVAVIVYIVTRPSERRTVVARSPASDLRNRGWRNGGLSYRPIGRSGESYPAWVRAKKFWRGQYGGQDHDPGLTYDRARCTVAVRVLPAERAMDEEARLIARLRPRDNVIGQPEELGADEAVPF